MTIVATTSVMMMVTMMMMMMMVVMMVVVMIMMVMIMMLMLMLMLTMVAVAATTCVRMCERGRYKDARAETAGMAPFKENPARLAYALQLLDSVI